MSFFKDERTCLHLMHPAMTPIIACINTSFAEPDFCVGFRSSRKGGFSLSLNGKVVCKGKTLTEFAERWRAMQDEALAKAAEKTTQKH